MTDQQICDRLRGALSVSMMPMEMELECNRFLDRSRWIPCSERMPKEDENVLAWTKYGEFCESAFWNGSYWVKTWSNDDISGVTHWRPLPEPPGKDDADGSNQT